MLGGFALSDELMGLLGTTDPYEYDDCSTRSDERLVSLVGQLGSKRASGYFAQLEVVELPEGTTDYRISEYDGFERVWYAVDGKIYDA